MCVELTSLRLLICISQILGYANDPFLGWEWCARWWPTITMGTRLRTLCLASGMLKDVTRCVRRISRQNHFDARIHSLPRFHGYDLATYKLNQKGLTAHTFGTVFGSLGGVRLVSGNPRTPDKWNRYNGPGENFFTLIWFSTQLTWVGFKQKHSELSKRGKLTVTWASISS